MYYMHGLVFLIGIAAACATLLGGFFALRFSDKLHLILGFSAGAVIGVAFFDLLPEAILLGGADNVSAITNIVALAFLSYLFIDRFTLLHAHTDEEGHGRRGALGAGSLAIHSFLDGMGIGFAFQVSGAVGWVVTAAVLAHDFSDGLNTVNLALRNHLSKSAAFRWLILDAFAPILGILASTLFTLPEKALGPMLAAFCGFFIYIGASDLLPESHHRHPTFFTTAMTALGIGVLYAAVSLVGF